jgi:DNA polymerase I-like protein with 3'-5' exonuclease and polymerase domains
MFTGRIRHFPNEGECYKALNNEIQGEVAEMVRVAMLRIDDALPQVYQDLQVHDSIVAEAPEEEAIACMQVMRECMEDFPFDPAPRVDFKAGPTWGSMQTVPRELLT